MDARNLITWAAARRSQWLDTLAGAFMLTLGLVIAAWFLASLLIGTAVILRWIGSIS